MKAVEQYLELLKLSGLDDIIQNRKQEVKKEITLNVTSNEEKLRRIYQLNKNCEKCPLSKERINFVYGEGDSEARLMLIGEGPGAEEDKTGKPFVGKSGQLLTNMLKAINIDREDVYIANIVKCRPPGNRNPLPNEVKSCFPFLIEQIDIIKPKVILLLGKVAAVNLLQETKTLGDFRSKIHYYKNIPVFATYHPSALLRNPAWKRPAWIDLQKLQAFLRNIS